MSSVQIQSQVDMSIEEGSIDFSIPTPSMLRRRNEQKRTRIKAIQSHVSFVWYWIKFIPVFGISGVFGSLVFKVLDRNFRLAALITEEACSLIGFIAGIYAGFLAVSALKNAGGLDYPGFPVMPTWVQRVLRGWAKKWKVWAE